ncbi:hypothetical protein AB0I81_18490 [Nonomuraea sp. NPDC050404]|uniref:hypothetical protein n=1 Tax=Nonomuraea sp. NPDC050404 TaxID=3155783 RepID=UPI0033F0AC04
MRVGRPVLSALLLCVAAVAGCATASETPTLEEAARRLDADAGHLLGASELQLSAVRRAGDATCVPGQVRHFFQAESDAAGAPDELLERLQAMGYDKVVDDLDLRDGDQDVSVLRDPATRVTFVLTVLAEDEPGVRVVGKTSCYAVD